jgi:hypothetical protein
MIFVGNFFLLRENEEFDGMFDNINYLKNICIEVAKLLQAKFITNYSPPPLACPKFIALQEDKE